MAFVPFKGFGKYGVVHDSPDEALPLGVWSNARNIRFSGIQMEKMLEPTIAALWDTETNGDPLWLQGWADGLSTYWAVATANRIFVLRRSGQNSVGEWQDVTRASGQYLFGQWQSFAWGNTVIFNNGRDVPQIFNQDTFRFEDLPKWGLISSVDDLTNNAAPTRQVEATCTHLYPLKSFLVASGVTENGLYQPNKIWWSDATALATFKDVGDKQGPPSWDYESPSTLSAQSEIAPESGAIRTAELLNDNLIIYTDAAATALSVVGGANVMASRRLFNKGAASLHSVCEFNNQHFCVSQDQIYIHDGSTVKLIAKDRVEEEFFTRIGKGGRFGDGQVEWALLQAVKNPDRKEIIITYGALGEDIPVNIPDNYSIATGAVQALPATASGTVVVPGDICKEYECDAFQQTVLSVINPYVYWAFDWPNGGPYPQDVVDKGSAGIDGRLTTLDVGYVGDDGYIDTCVGTLDVPAPNDTTIIANPDKVAPNFWQNGISLLENCTVGMLFNISTARGVSNSPIIMSTDPGFNWAWQVRFNTASNTFGFRSLSSWPDQYFTLVADTVDLSNILWDVDGNPIWVQLAVWVSRDEVLQEMNLKAYINGVSIASKSESFLDDPRTNFQVDDVEGNPKQLQIKGDGPFSESPSGAIYVDHVWMQVGETTPAQQQQLFSAFEQNQSDYVDPDPNCQPACKEYECDAYESVLLGGGNVLSYTATDETPNASSQTILDKSVGTTRDSFSVVDVGPYLSWQPCDGADNYCDTSGATTYRVTNNGGSGDPWNLDREWCEGLDDCTAHGFFRWPFISNGVNRIAVAWMLSTYEINMGVHLIPDSVNGARIQFSWVGSDGTSVNNPKTLTTDPIPEMNMVAGDIVWFGIHTRRYGADRDCSFDYTVYFSNLSPNATFEEVASGTVADTGQLWKCTEIEAFGAFNVAARIQLGEQPGAYGTGETTNISRFTVETGAPDISRLAALAEGFHRTFDTYVDPDPNCQNVCKEYECDSFITALQQEVDSHWKLEDGITAGSSEVDQLGFMDFPVIGTGAKGLPIMPDECSVTGSTILNPGVLDNTSPPAGLTREGGLGFFAESVTPNQLNLFKVTYGSVCNIEVSITSGVSVALSLAGFPSHTYTVVQPDQYIWVNWNLVETIPDNWDLTIEVFYDFVSQGTQVLSSNDTRGVDINVTGLQMGFGGTGQWLVQHSAYSSTQLDAAQIATLKEARDQNRSDYVDPNPNCVPAVQAQITKTPRRKDDPPTIQIPRRPGRDII